MAVSITTVLSNAPFCTLCGLIRCPGARCVGNERTIFRSLGDLSVRRGSIHGGLSQTMASYLKWKDFNAKVRLSSFSDCLSETR